MKEKTKGEQKLDKKSEENIYPISGSNNPKNGQEKKKMSHVGEQSLGIHAPRTNLNRIRHLS